MNERLKHWIAQTSSWETFVELKIPDEYMAKYDFIERFDDLYISLLGKVFDHIRNMDTFEVNEELRVLASGFQFYRLNQSEHIFPGVNRDKGLLICGLVHYLSGYPATSSLICKNILFRNLDLVSQKFAYNFLSRKRFRNHRVEIDFDLYLRGDLAKLDSILNDLEAELEIAAEKDAEDFVFLKLTILSLKRFKANSIWRLKEQYPTRNFDALINDLISRTDHIWELFPSQWQAISEGLVEDNNTITLQMPTSAGKTAISEIVLYDFCKRFPNKKAVLFAPFRALASELKGGFCRRLSKVGIKTKVIYGGGTSTNFESDAIEEANLIVSTPEKFMSVDAIKPEYRDNVGLIICDEGHLLDDENRGLSYELLVSSFKRTPDREMKIVYISAIVPNISDVHKWLGGAERGLVSSRYRPSRIDYAVLKHKGGNEFQLEVNPTEQFPNKYILSKFLRDEELKYPNPATNRMNTYTIRGNNKRIAACTALKACRLGSVALFTTQKNLVHDLGEILIELTDLFPQLNVTGFCDTNNKQLLEEYLRYSLGETSLLMRLVSRGLIYHHGSLPQELRERAEWAIREHGVVGIVCTNTLAEGVNLPVRTLVIHTIKRFNIQTSRWKTIRKRDIKNIVGRSGRAGKSIKGLVILSNQKELPDFSKVINDVDIEKVNGRLFSVTEDLMVQLILDSNVTNELLSGKPESLQVLVDEIDLSIVSLVGPRAQTGDQIVSLIEKTFGFDRLQLSERNFVKNIASLRWQVIQPYVENGDIAFLKEGAISPRYYELIKGIVIASLTMAPVFLTDCSAEDVVNYYWDILVQCRQFEELLRNFNKRYEIGITADSLKPIARNWMTGLTYSAMATVANLSVEIILAIVSELFGYNIQSLIKVINSTVVSNLGGQLTLGFGMDKFGECLAFGINSSVKLEFIEAGVGDRLVAHRLANWFRTKGITSTDRTFLRNYLGQNGHDISTFLSQDLPQLCVREFASFAGILNEFEDLL